MTTPAIASPAASGAQGGTSQSSSTTESPNGVLGQNEFLKLMIAQLQAQNPLEPGNSNEYLSELAQFTQVEQTTNLANASELTGAVQLIGHTVSYNDPATGASVSGTVQSVQSAASGTSVTVEGIAGVKLSSITEVD